MSTALESVKKQTQRCIDFLRKYTALLQGLFYASLSAYAGFHFAFYYLTCKVGHPT